MNIDLTPGGPTGTEILDHARRRGVVLFGAGAFARSVAKCLAAAGVTVRAFVVSSPATTSCDGIPLRALAELDDDLRELPMWLCVFNREAHSDLADLHAKCKTVTGVDPVPPQHFYDLLAESLGWRFWLTERRNYASVEREIRDTLALFEDDLSRRMYAETIAFRLGQNLGQAPRPCDSPQYFPDFLVDTLNAEVNFVDGGAFDGDTVAEAAKHLRLATAYAFEPDPANFDALAKRAAGFGFPVVCLPCGLSEQTQLVPCGLGQGEACTIDENGAGRIQVARLDDVLPNAKIDLLKLDVEGHELQAIAGASESIRRNRPAMTIAGYHLWDDLWRIPEVLTKMLPGHRLAYRIHGHNTFDAVFYAYPSP